MRRHRLAGQPSATPLLLDKGKDVASSIPSLGQGDTHSLAKVTSCVDPKAAVEGPTVEPTVSVE